MAGQIATKRKEEIRQEILKLQEQSDLELLEEDHFHVEIKLDDPENSSEEQ